MQGSLNITCSGGELSVLDVVVDPSHDLVEALELVGSDLTGRAHHDRVLEEIFKHWNIWNFLICNSTTESIN